MHHVVFHGDLIQQFLGGDPQHQPVAVVDAQDPEEAFAVSNSHHEGWETHPGVFCLVACPRSTSVGDLLVNDQMEVFEVMDVGFERRYGLSHIEQQAAAALLLVSGQASPGLMPGG